MTPKKAIIIVLILFFIAAIIFFVLYINKPADSQLIKQPADSGYNNTSVPVEQKIEAIETKTNQQIEQIVEQGQTSTGGITAEAQRKIDDAVNQEITEKLKLKTPEQIEADEQRQAEPDRMEQEINQQIRDQLQAQ
ncbi:MAG: hypothetical protein ABIB72_03540 [Candidatus Falkowbacteria bacterium]